MRLPDRCSPRARPARPCSRTSSRSPTAQERPRHGVRRRQHQQGDQPLLAGPRRPRPRALRGVASVRRTWSGRRATRSRARSTTDQQNLVNTTGDAYWLFKNTFGRDSFDGEGATMNTVNNDPTIACPNANWNGATTNYCDGVTLRRRGRARVGPRLHRVHLRPGLPVAVRRAERVVLRRLGRDRRPDQRPRRRRTRSTRRASSASARRTPAATSRLVINSPAAVAGPCVDAPRPSFGPVFNQAGRPPTPTSRPTSTRTRRTRQHDHRRLLGVQQRRR